MKLLIKLLYGLILIGMASCSNSGETEKPEETVKGAEIDSTEMEGGEETVVEEVLIEEVVDIDIDLFETIRPRNKSVPVFDSYEIIEKTTLVYIEELMEEAVAETYSVLLLEEPIEELGFDTTAFSEVVLKNSDVEDDSVLYVSACFRINDYTIVQYLTKRNEYNNSDWIIIFKDGEMVWSKVARHFDSCEDSSAKIAGVVSSSGQHFLMIEHDFNDYSYVEINEGFKDEYLHNSKYDPNLDYRM